tara:strand:- start:1270 stop:2949 length:1680 start_codon:yes stop_codon:yes gene_type:complete
VEGAQLTWKQTFYALCKALNTERGTFADAQGAPKGRDWYLRMVKEQQKPRADQRQGLLERALFEWSLNPNRAPVNRERDYSGRAVPPPVMRECARAWYAAHPAWVLDPVDVNAKRAFYATLDRRLIDHVERAEAEPLRALVGLGADIDVRSSYYPPTPLLQTIRTCLSEDVTDARREAAFGVLDAVLALGADVNYWMPEGPGPMGRPAYPPTSPLGWALRKARNLLGPNAVQIARMQALALRVAKALLNVVDFGPDPGSDLLLGATQLKSTELVRLLLAHPGVVVTRDDPALAAAVRLAGVDPILHDIFTLLVQDGRIDPAAQPRGNRYDSSPLVFVVANGSVAMLREMLQYARPPIDLDAQYNGEPLLVLAAGLRDRPGDFGDAVAPAATVAFFLESGVSEASRAVLRAAQEQKVNEMFAALWRMPTYEPVRGGSLGRVDTVVALSAYRYTAVIPFLLPGKRVYGDAINAKHDRGDTVLHIAAKKGHSFVVEALLRIPGVDVTRRNDAGRTALDEARRRANASGSMMRDLSRAALAEMDKVIRALVRAAPDYDPDEVF